MQTLIKLFLDLINKMEPLQDIKIFCKTCQQEFVWTAREQLYYKKKGFAKKPQKCNRCREKANKLRENGMFYIHCGVCDKDGGMLAPPPKDRVALCADCYSKLVSESKKDA